MRSDAAPRRLVGQRHDRVDGAPGFERADLLQVLALEPHAHAELGIERGARHHRSAVNVRRNPPQGLADCFNRDHECVSYRAATIFRMSRFSVYRFALIRTSSRILLQSSEEST